MDQNFEQNFRIEYVIFGFLALIALSTWLQRKQRAKNLLRQGQLNPEGGRIPSIEERVSGNSDWSKGEIRAAGIGPVIAIWVVAIVWNLTFGFSFFKSFSNPEMKAGGLVVLGIFATLGIVPIYFAIRLTLQRFRFGDSWCCIAGKAGVVGNKMTGFIRTNTEVNASGDYIILLQCIETYQVGSGKNRRTETTIHWKGEDKVPSAGKSSRMGIPFTFTLPPYVQETGYQLSRGTITWNMRIDAPVKGGVDYTALFVVPVFKMD